jgi:hypothetical protein
MMGGLSEMSFLIDLWSRNTIPFCKKIKMAEILGWVKNHFFYLKNLKSEIFQKVLSRFVVLNSAIQSKMADFLLFIFKNLTKINEQIFFHSVK